MTAKKYIPQEIEPKWQKRWAEAGFNKIDLTDATDKKYILVEFTYPSGDLHIGHWFAFAIPDIYARFSRMTGFRVFMPNGFDAFGLPAENAAIKRGIHPRDWTLSNIETMMKQFALMGASYDWDHMVITCESDYYRWNQWIFLKMLDRGIAYRGKSLTNWCPNDQTVLADEQVVNGRCDRCGNQVEQKEVEQWFLKITDYAERLLWPPEAYKVDWPKSIREGQNNWIGKSEGTMIKWTMDNGQWTIKDRYLEVYTTRPDTIFGVTFMAVSPEHPLLNELVLPEQQPEVEKYIRAAGRKTELERKENQQKTGVFTGSYVKNPISGEKIPVWVADYVLASYGTGAIMAVPAHDQRDFEFAKKFNLSIKQVIAQVARGPVSVQPHSTSSFAPLTAGAQWGAPFTATPRADDTLPYTGEGVLINSGEYDGLASSEAREKISDDIEKRGLGNRKIQYHLHDWSISRQRYWGTPIPIVYCDNCGIVPVPEDQLPVELPYQVEYAPTGKSPLAKAEDWIKVKCPNCGGEGRRETDTMDGFFDNSWYFLRYLDPKNNTEIFNKEIVKKWLPVDVYFGGAEHTLGHTLYSRFFVKFLFDLGLLEFDEYAQKRVNHGIILGPDGNKMSKSRGNVINPDDEVSLYGADSVRIYLAFLGPYEIVAPWNPAGINGVYHFLQRVWGLQEKLVSVIARNEMTKQSQTPGAEIASPDGHRGRNDDLRMMHKTIKKVTADISQFKFNTAVAALMKWLNYLSRQEQLSLEEYKTFLLLLAPFAPHMTEELWQGIQPSESDDWSIHQQKWPKADENLLEEARVTITVQINGKFRDTIELSSSASEQEAKELALRSERIKKFLATKEPKKIIYVPSKVLNIVI